MPKSTSSGSAVSGASGSGSITGSGAGAASSMTPMLGHQYIMGQGVPYAFQQPMYSYEDIQLMQQRIPHMVSQLHLFFQSLQFIQILTNALFFQLKINLLVNFLICIQL